MSVCAFPWETFLPDDYSELRVLSLQGLAEGCEPFEWRCDLAYVCEATAREKRHKRLLRKAGRLHHCRRVELNGATGLLSVYFAPQRQSYFVVCDVSEQAVEVQADALKYQAARIHRRWVKEGRMLSPGAALGYFLKMAAQHALAEKRRKED